MGLLSCSNAQSDYLKDYGYGTLALPKANVQPLLMMTSNGKNLVPAGPLAATFIAGAAPLPAIVPARAGSISGARSKSIKASIGLDILGKVIGALAGSSLGIKAAYDKASTVEFEFGDVFEQRADFNALDSFLGNAATAGTIGPSMRQLLEKDEIYVITAIIETSSIKVKGTTSKGASLAMDVPTIKQLVGGKIGVDAAGTGNSLITYSAVDQPLTIGAEVVRLYFDKGKFTVAKPIKAGDTHLGMAAAAPAEKVPDIVVPKGLLMF